MKHKTYFRTSILCALFVMGVTLPLAAEAATLYFVSPSERVYQGDVFSLEIHLDSKDESINAFQADLDFSREALEIESFDRTNSLFKLWPQEPSIFNELGSVSFAGGLPSPGFQGTHGFVGVFEIFAKNVGAVRFGFRETSRVLLNDGLGTETSLELREAAFTVLTPPKGYTPKSKVLVPDVTPPAPFSPIITQSDIAFDGKYFAVFGTEDYESGISRYEIYEVPRIVTPSTTQEEWRVAKSPYVFRDQGSGKHTVKVRAYDRAGNVQEESVSFVIPKKKLNLILAWLIIFIAFAIPAVILYKKIKYGGKI